MPLRRALILLALGLSSTRADDCNGNGLPDSADIQARLKLAAAQSVEAGLAARACAIGRMDGDAKPDVVVCGDGAVAVLLGLGEARFAAPRVFPAIALASEIVLGDLDADGADDAVVTSPGAFPEPGGMAILWNEGGGELGAPRSAGALESPRGLAILDLDGDGDLDLAIADRATSEIVLFANAGGRVLERIAPREVARGPVRVVAADFDRDGATDLACLSDLSSTLGLLWNDGHGAFAEVRTLHSGRLPTSLASVDLNRDGLPDLVATQDASRDVRVFLGAPGREVAEASVIPLSDAAEDVGAGDVDADGDPDVCILVNSLSEGGLDPHNERRVHSEARILENNGTAGFPARRELLVGPGARSIRLADLDQDGRVEVLAAHEVSGTISILRNDPANGFPAPAILPAFSDRPFAASDFDQDGAADLVFSGSGFFPAEVHWSDGDGSFARIETLPFQFVSGITSGDFDGDGDADIAIVDRPAPWEKIPRQLRFCWNREGGKLEVGDGVELHIVGAPVSCDIDRDGDLDIAMTGAILWNLGGGVFEESLALPAEVRMRLAIFADWDGDGDLDPIQILEPSQEVGPRGEPRIIEPGALVIYSNLGHDSFQRAFDLPAQAWPSDVAAGDLDGDADLDLAVTDVVAGELRLWRQASGGRFELSGLLPAGTQPVSIDAGDLDLDGDPDLAVADGARSRVIVFGSYGGGSLQVAGSIAVDGDPTQLKILQVDRSGSPGIVVACDASFRVWTIRNESAPPRSTDCNGNGSPDECDISSGISSDADGNGLPDECGARFRRGEVNQDGAVDLSDAVSVFGFLFLGTPARLECRASADIDRSGRIDVSDGIALLGYLFLQGASPSRPFEACGFDPGSALTCDGASACP